jgi:dTDP-4-dehydrorhamnose reductase
VLLTGGSGFVGSALVRVFAAHGADVVAPAHAELDVSERAARGTVARIAGVQGGHRAPRGQDHGFGYLVESVVAALRAGEPFTVWEGPHVNMRATPTLARDAGELIWRALELGATGTLHCCGGEHADRVTLARRAAVAFDLGPALIRTGPPPPPRDRVPYDTRLDARATAERLGVELPGIDAVLAGLREEVACLTT